MTTEDQPVEMDAEGTNDEVGTEIGGALLDILSRGLYSDAKDAIREYVQNGVDARATTIRVTVRGPEVTIRDNGRGMTWEEVRKARRFGVSDKNPRSHVGYRGIGIYSSFGMCKKLSILTHPAKSNEQFRLAFDFGKMREILERDRDSEESTWVPLESLLRNYTSFKSEPYDESREDSFTLVTLEGLSQEYRAQLHDEGKVYDYLLNSLPVALPSKSYGPKVNEWLRERAELNPIRLILRIGSDIRREVQPSIVPTVLDPRARWIKGTESENLAFMWYAVSKRGQRVPAQSSASGFLLKMKGFTLGDRDALKPLWPRIGGRALYQHFTGEIHLLASAKVYPNAARNGLEPSPSQQFLSERLTDEFRRLNQYADDTRILVRSSRVSEASHRAVDELEERMRSGDQNPFELYREAKDLEEDLERVASDLTKVIDRKKSPLTSEQSEWAKDVTSNSLRLLESLRQMISEVNRRSEAKPKLRRRRHQASPPQSAVLIRVATHIEAAYKASSDEVAVQAWKDICEAREANAVQRAVEVLDGLRASGRDVPDEVETARIEMRASLGLTPQFPVSLEEALAEEGLLLDTDRESWLVSVMDQSLLDISGGRGERYDEALATIMSQLGDLDVPVQGGAVE